MSLTPGTRLGSYEIAGRIGAGGMGEVYRARDTKLNRDVAIKVLPDLFALDPDRLARFEREAQTLAALNHPHIAQIYGIEGGGALVMELVDGRRSLGADRARAHAARRGAADRQPDRRRARGRARAAHRPSRPEARQHQGPRRRHGEGARLRSRQGDRLRTARRWRERHAVADADGPRDADGRHHRDRGLHGAGTGARQGGRSARRHLGVRRRPLRDAHRAAAVWRRGHQRGPRACARTRSGLDASSGFTAGAASPPARAMPDEGSESTPPRHQRSAFCHRRSHRRAERSGDAGARGHRGSRQSRDEPVPARGPSSPGC